ncbi:hypothetical protein FB451DRAFT_1390114 [Mycena latifolia]|nr:hypothetical protein FB451DRAFT_1390114 [Mycena latifolia]
MSASSFRLSAPLDAPEPPIHDTCPPNASFANNDASKPSNYVPGLPNTPPDPPKFNAAPLFTIPEYNPGAAFDTPPPPRATGVDEVGSFEYDLAHNFTLRWSSLLETQSWKTKELSLAKISFDPDTFDLTNDDALGNLNNKELRALCKNYNVDPALANAQMVSRLRQFRARCFRPQVPPIPQPVCYPPYPYYYSYYPSAYPGLPSSRPAQ